MPTVSLGMLGPQQCATRRTHLERAAPYFWCLEEEGPSEGGDRGTRGGRTVKVPMHFHHYIPSSQADYDSTTTKHSLKLSVLNIRDAKCNLKVFNFSVKILKTYFSLFQGPMPSCSLYFHHKFRVYSFYSFQFFYSLLYTDERF